MAKELFITQWFSNEMLLAGATLIKRLDDTDAQIAAAFWLLNTEEKMWELTIASSLVESEGSRMYYKRINDVNDSANPDEEIISLHDIQVVNTNNRIIRAIQHSNLRQSLPENNRLGRNTIGDVSIEDMYLYRMDWTLLTPENTAVT